MAGGLVVTPAQLEALSSTIAKTAGEVHGLHSALKGQLSPLFGADWVGTASGRFQQLYTDFDTSATKLNEALQGISQLLGAAGRSYAEAESQIAQSFSG
jgi:early secretory antigenic target protein ESAT-6